MIRMAAVMGVAHNHQDMADYPCCIFDIASLPNDAMHDHNQRPPSDSCTLLGRLQISCMSGPSCTHALQEPPPPMCHQHRQGRVGMCMCQRHKNASGDVAMHHHSSQGSASWASLPALPAQRSTCTTWVLLKPQPLSRLLASDPAPRQCHVKYPRRQSSCE